MISYTLVMARGWESKSVDEQIGAAEAERDAQAQRQTSRQQREQQERRKSLLLSRAQILGRLKLARNQRYRAQLESALAFLDSQLQALD